MSSSGHLHSLKLTVPLPMWTSQKKESPPARATPFGNMQQCRSPGWSCPSPCHPQEVNVHFLKFQNWEKYRGETSNSQEMGYYLSWQPRWAQLITKPIMWVTWKWSGFFSKPGSSPLVLTQVSNSQIPQSLEAPEQSGSAQSLETLISYEE